jgi:hypothetical protein
LPRSHFSSSGCRRRRRTRYPCPARMMALPLV